MWTISDNALTSSAESKELTNTIQEITASWVMLFWVDIQIELFIQ